MAYAKNTFDDVKAIISALLVPEKPPKNISIVKLDQLYREDCGERIPFRELGFPSLLDLLKRIDFINVYQYNGGHYLDFLGTSKTRHVSELVARQKHRNKSRPPPRRNIPSSYFPSDRFNYNYSSSTSVINMEIKNLIIAIIDQHPRGLTKNELTHKVRAIKPGFNFDSSILNNYLLSLGSSVIVRENMIYPARNTITNSNVPISYYPSNKSNTSTSTEKSGFIFDDDDYNDPIMCDENGWDIYTPPIPEENLKEQNSFQNNHSEISDHSTQQDEKFISKQNSSENNELENTSREKKEKGSDEEPIYLSQRTRFRLEKLMQNSPHGIWCSELPKKYKDEYKVDLDWQDYDFDSLSQFAAHFDDIFHCIRPYDQTDFMLFDAKHEIPGKKADLRTKPSMASLYKLYRDPEDVIPALGSKNEVPTTKVHYFLPENVLSLGESIGQIPVSQFKDDFERFEEVIVVEAFTPSFFWIHLRHKINAFYVMMEELDIFYNINKEDFKIPDVAIAKGLNVACEFYGKWHRGIIKEITVHPTTSATVLFYDFGTIKSYPPNELYCLHRSFGHLPAQAIPCGLFNVKPIGGSEWPKSTSRKFIQRVYDKPMIAFTGKIDCDNNSMLIILTDTSGEDDIHINDWLIERNLAMQGNMVRIRPRNFVYQYDLQCKGRRPVSKSNYNSSSKNRNISRRYDSNCLTPIKVLKSLSNNINNNTKTSNTLSNQRITKKNIPKGCQMCPSCGQKLPEVLPLVENNINVIEKVEEEIKKPTKVEEKIKKPTKVEEKIKKPEKVEEEIKKPTKVKEEIKKSTKVEEKIKKPEKVEEEIKKPEKVEEEIKKPTKVKEEIKKSTKVKEKIKKPEKVKKSIEKRERVEEKIEKPPVPYDSKGIKNKKQEEDLDKINNEHFSFKKVESDDEIESESTRLYSLNSSFDSIKKDEILNNKKTSDSPAVVIGQTGLSALLNPYDDEFDQDAGYLKYVKPYKVKLESNSIDWSVFRTKTENNKENISSNDSPKEIVNTSTTDMLKKIDKPKRNILSVDNWYSKYTKSQTEDIEKCDELAKEKLQEVTPLIREVLINIQKSPDYDKIILPADVFSTIDNLKSSDGSCFSDEAVSGWDNSYVDKQIENQKSFKKYQNTEKDDVSPVPAEKKSLLQNNISNSAIEITMEVDDKNNSTTTFVNDQKESSITIKKGSGDDYFNFVKNVCLNTVSEKMKNFMKSPLLKENISVACSVADSDDLSDEELEDEKEIPVGKEEEQIHTEYILDESTKKTIVDKNKMKNHSQYVNNENNLSEAETNTTQNETINSELQSLDDDKIEELSCYNDLSDEKLEKSGEIPVEKKDEKIHSRDISDSSNENAVAEKKIKNYSQFISNNKSNLSEAEKNTTPNETTNSEIHSLDDEKIVEMSYNNLDEDVDFDRVSDITDNSINSSNLDTSLNENLSDADDNIDTKSSSEVAIMEKPKNTLITSEHSILPYTGEIPVFNDLDCESDGSEWDVNPPSELEEAILNHIKKLVEHEENNQQLAIEPEENLKLEEISEIDKETIVVEKDVDEIEKEQPLENLIEQKHCIDEMHSIPSCSQFEFNTPVKQKNSDNNDAKISLNMDDAKIDEITRVSSTENVFENDKSSLKSSGSETPILDAVIKKQLHKKFNLSSPLRLNLSSADYLKKTN